MHKFLKILLAVLLVLSLVGVVIFYVQNSTGLFALGNMAEALSTTNMLDVLLFWAYFLVFAALLLVIILSIINIAGNRKSLIRTGIILLIAVVVVGVSYLLASGDPVVVNLATPPTHGQLKLTDTLLIMVYILLGCALVALIWGGIRKLIQNR